MQIPRGKITVIIGRSGTGKSVTLKHAMGLVPPDEGQIWVGDRELGRMGSAEKRAIRLRFGMVFQHAALFDSMSVFENVAFPLHEHTKLSDADVRTRVESVLGDVGLLFAIDKQPDELSGGMKKRAGLARALIHTPEILLYDEPTTGLDPILTAAIDQLIVETQARNPGMTSLVVSHDMQATFRIADHILFMHEGKVIAQGGPDAFRETDDPLVRQFVEGRLDGPMAVE
ncbi:MAG: ATP-binding cassette domain-containing protein [Proteobacteria bacterium]|nr:ATP-binding cassette domain-containing protein [Pseudomonadota bacterium]MCP4918517.1 ATP-binding cassette domain-containing protein [Pseudomonadota bacterium]